MSKQDKKRFWVGLDLGGTKMLAKVFDDKFDDIGSCKKKTEGFRGMEAGLKRMAKTISQALEEAGVKPDQLGGIGVGCPGPVNPEKGTIIEAPNLGWVKAPVKRALEKEFGCPVAVCNDVDAGTFAEYEFGAAKGAKCAVGIFPGTGIGGGAVLRGRLLQGASISCMEIGHIPLYPDGAGGATTLENVASRLAIAAQSASAAYRGQAPHLLGQCGTDLSKITSSRLADAIQNGDEAIADIVRNAARILGCGVATVVQLMTPDIVVLGGGLVAALPDLYVPTVLKAANDMVLAPFRGTFKVVAAQLSDDASVLGAAAWAKRQLEAE